MKFNKKDWLVIIGMSLLITVIGSISMITVFRIAT